MRRSRRIVTAWMASEAYRRLREGSPVVSSEGAEPDLPSGLRIVEGRPQDRYVTCVPLVPLKVAAGAFGEPQNVSGDGFPWVTTGSYTRLKPGMFVARVVGMSMEPRIPAGSYCLFATPVEGSRQGKIVLVELRDAVDPDTGHRYTVKTYESEKVHNEDGWEHRQIVLRPINPDFAPITLAGDEKDQVAVVAELVAVLGTA